MKLTWQDRPAEADDREFILTGEFIDRDGKPFYFCQAWVASERETDRLRREQRVAEQEIGRAWQRRWRMRMRQAEKLGVNVRDVPCVGDAVAPGHVFGVDWYVRLRDGVVTAVDVTRRRDGSPRTPPHLS